MSRAPRPDREFKAPVARYRIRFAKRGRVRFASHRDFQRAFERALRRVGVPMAYSAGFSPHPKISYANAVATGAASEAEYVEIGVMAEQEPNWLAQQLDAALPVGFDVVDVVTVCSGDFANRLEASLWRIELPGADPAEVEAAVGALLGAESVEVQRMTKKGLRTFDVRSALLDVACGTDAQGCAILTMVVRHAVPAVRPDDVLAGLRQVAALATPLPPRVTRMAQGPLGEDRRSVADPLAEDRAGAAAAAGS
ncbi:MAG: TIGR03936 family radical SAM-associated protein [Candidatus Nanopelagicales bacterium]